MKVYAITISDVYDFEGFPHKPIVCKTKRDAMVELRELRERVLIDLKENGNDDWIEDEFNENSECFSFYPDGEWGTSHYDAFISEVEVKE